MGWIWPRLGAEGAFDCEDQGLCWQRHASYVAGASAFGDPSSASQTCARENNPGFARCSTPPTQPTHAIPVLHTTTHSVPRTNGRRNHAAASAPDREGRLVRVPPFLRFLIPNLCVGRAPGDPYCHQDPALPLRVRRPESLQQLTTAQGLQPERQVLALPRHHRRWHRRIRRACPRTNR